MRKIICAVVLLALVVSLAACGKEAPEVPETVPVLTEAPPPPPTEPPETTVPPETTLPPETMEETVPETTAPPETEPAETEETAAPEDPGIRGVTARITGAYEVNVRKAPSVRSDLVTKLKQGTLVTVYEVIQQDNADWANTNEGWISMKYLTLDGPLPHRDPALGQLGTVSHARKVNVRKEPTVNSEKVGELQEGDLVHVHEFQEVVGVIWGRTDEGWVSMDYIEISEDGQDGGLSLPESTGNKDCDHNYELKICDPGKVEKKLLYYCQCGKSFESQDAWNRHTQDIAASYQAGKISQAEASNHGYCEEYMDEKVISQAYDIWECTKCGAQWYGKPGEKPNS